MSEHSTRRQLVNFTGFKLDAAFRRLPREEREAARAEFLAALNTPPQGMILLTYSTVGLRAETDLLLWRIAWKPEDFSAHSRLIYATRLGAYLHNAWSLLSMTKRSMYMDKLDPFHEPESRSRIIPGKRKYLFIYPFVKSRPWYLLPMDERQKIMDEHIRVGNKYPSVKLNTTYSFGLDDQDFVVAFETDEPADFLDLVMELRETEGSKYTVRDTPIYTAMQTPLDEILAQLF